MKKSFDCFFLLECLCLYVCVNESYHEDDTEHLDCAIGLFVIRLNVAKGADEKKTKTNKQNQITHKITCFALQ